MSEPVQREDVSAATALKRLDDHEAPTAVGIRNVEKVLMSGRRLVFDHEVAQPADRCVADAQPRQPARALASTLLASLPQATATAVSFIGTGQTEFGGAAKLSALEGVNRLSRRGRRCSL